MYKGKGEHLEIESASRSFQNCSVGEGCVVWCD